MRVEPARQKAEPLCGTVKVGVAVLIVIGLLMAFVLVPAHARSADALRGIHTDPMIAHFHHVHLNSTDPEAAIKFYTGKFDCERANFLGSGDAVWAQKSWLLFNKVSTPPPSGQISAIWHIGWGAEDMKAAYQKQLDSGTKFFTPLTD
ncbi:MAG TPA: VOC family protein, partial [Blastocatellia bacterium]